MSSNAPDVSVVIGAYQAMPYLIRCLESVEAQTLGAGRLEIIAVDDGSTDGTGEYLDAFAARTAIDTRVVHQENSGGPSGPRNTGLGLARGRYVFFLDADDYFGEEALERMVAMGDRAGTDVVLGKVVGVNRGAAKSMWKQTVERADIYFSQVKFTLSAQKLFRRELLVRLGMSFDEKLKTGEDALFTLEAYLRGNGVSVVADYTCYYLVGREDGKHVTKSGSYELRFDSARALTGLIAEHVPPGPKRDALMVRPFVITLLPQFGPGFLKQSAAVRKRKMELAAPLMAQYWTRGLAGSLKVQERLRLICVAKGRPDLLMDILRFVKEGREPEIVRGERPPRLWLAYPHFREGTELPESAYQVRVTEWRNGRRIDPPVPAASSLAHRFARKVRRVLRTVRPAPLTRRA
ncbi:MULTISPECIES: glycosyltransferase family 2 protein [unclassified Streptomyces]|uniref:glycosyltransferase family 2 protein n=1 Tax=unclassified Streptomyces TaxID=2593676 RepID=UPI00081B5975|nr:MULTISPECIES: glycosyltransferase family 2 protein [unclassified Streptomyces]MYQ50707.1 glycosyltransferase [Streptomyces sp. SID4941]SCD45976.1 Glycosyltransferase involved in cell wall bisynthesis [Streptomyces sp. PalvLS-984]SDC60355.1 Glycosyltransferase involved in cell wall bisynthesis [Streptomyces sp. AmelKG-A3]